MEKPEEPQYLTLVLCVILAIIGGTAKELSDQQKQFSWRVFLSNIFIAGFSGIIFGLCCENFEHKNWILAGAAISGYAGEKFISFMTGVLETIIKDIAGNILKK